MPTIFRDKVTVGTATFNEVVSNPIITSGVIGDWGLDVLLGWHDTPEVEAEFAPKGFVDGEVPAEFFPVRGKNVTIGGYMTASTRAGVEELFDVVVRDALPRNTALELVRYEGIPKKLFCRRTGPVTLVWTGPLAARWGATVRASDPFRYGINPITGSIGVTGTSTGGRSYPRTYPLSYTTISNGQENQLDIYMLGTADSAKWTVELEGPLTAGGWRIVNEVTGDFLKLDVALTGTDTLLIDFEHELFYVNGVLTTATITGDFFHLTPKLNELRLYADFDADAQMHVTAYPAWE